MAADSLYIQHLQHGGDANISVICTAVGKLRNSVAFLQGKKEISK
jgi:hypothetical protein